jgi:hypothetical protein
VVHLGVVVILGLTAGPARAQATDPIPVEAQVPARTYYVGQSIELRIGVLAGSERPRIVAPQVAGAEVTPRGTGLKPIASSAIGDSIAERNVFLARFRLVPRRAGVLEVPPVVARLGARSGASRPIRLMIHHLPLAGRPAGFLGGVGAFRLEAETNVAMVRVGQEFEYRIRMIGPAARGSAAAPDLQRFDRVPLGLEIEPMTSEPVADPPARVFGYRIRPTRAGTAVLPPVAIAAFDPTAARYVTKVTPGVAVRVVDVPRFDPATLDYGAPAERTPSGLGRAAAWVVSAAAGVIAMVVTLVILGRRRAHAARGPRAARRLVRRIADRLDRGGDAAEAARRITEGLAAYLNQVQARPLGALTPAEARLGIEQATGCAGLGEHAERLVARCDRAQYAATGQPTAEDLVGEARRLLDDLKRSGTGSRRGNDREGCRGGTNPSGGGEDKRGSRADLD